MSAETIDVAKNNLLELGEHIKTLNKDSDEYDRATANFVVLQKSIVEAETAESERVRKQAERVQAIKQWQEEQKQKEAQAEEEHNRFMIRLAADAVGRLFETLVFTDYVQGSFMCEHDTSLVYKVGMGVRSKFERMFFNRR